MSRRKKRVKSNNQGFFPTWSKDARFQTIVGLFVMVLALLLMISLVSYLFTWKDDQQFVLNLNSDFLIDSEMNAQNWLGRLGAFVSHYFFYYGFGIASFVIPVLLFQLGQLITFGGSWKRMFTRILYWLYTLVLISIIADFFTQESHFAWGGAVGSYAQTQISGFIGAVGTLIFLMFLTAAYCILLFNISPTQLKSFGSWIPSNDYSPSALLFFRKNSKKKDVESKNSAGAKENKSDLIDLESGKESSTSPYEFTTISMGDDFSDRISEENPDEDPVILKQDDKRGGDFSDSDSGRDTELEINETGDINPIMEIAVEDKDKESEPYDPSLELSSYVKPEIDLLESHDGEKVSINREELEENKNQIIRTLSNYKIDIVKIRATIGPTVTLYEIVPAPGVRIQKIKNLEDDIALSLAALGIRIIAPIPGKGTIGIEVPNKKKQIVSLRELIKTDKFQKTGMDLPIALGKTISNEVYIADLAKMPHLLMAGATGQGKSVGINAILVSLLYHNHPSRVKLVLIDPKKVELYPYGKLEKHFLAQMPGQHEPIITDTTKVIETLNSLCIEMDQRYDLLKKARARNIREYNKKFVDRKLNPQKGHKFLPFIVLVIDEFADLIMTAGKEIEMPIARLAQLARAVGIHLVIATQRPSVNIITGIIKANFPARIAYKVTSKIDSRTILDAGGADQLIGRGDMLLSVGGNVIRLQCAFVDTPEVEDVLDHIGDQRGYPEPYLLPEFSVEGSTGTGGISAAELDEMFDEAALVVVQAQSGSTSMIQRKLKLGFNRAGRIMDQLEAFGIVGASEGSKAREVLVYSEDELNRLLQEIHSNNPIS
ncbi:MAG: DNA translocase FtsK [Saprospirales bacterium]|nr:MAG: DNA translocase FtsK [Saprospirales bacterium]